MKEGVKAQRYHDGKKFSVAEFSTGSGVFLTCMVVPKPGTTGSSPDFTSGPIIPNSLFPMHDVAVAHKDGSVFDPFLADFTVPALTPGLDPRYDVDGHSHFPVFLATNKTSGRHLGGPTFAAPTSTTSP